MSFLQSVRGLFERKSAGPDWGVLERYLAWSFGGGTSASGIIVNPQTAMQAAAVYSCVQVLAQSVGMLPCVPYTEDATGKRAPAVDHPLHELLRYQPNEYQTCVEFFEMLVMCLCLRGNSYAYVNRTRSGRVVELLPLHPDMVRCEMAADFTLSYQITMPDGGFKQMQPGEIFHVRGLTLNGWLGISPIAYMRESIGLALATEKFGGQLFRNGAKMGGVLEHPGKIGQEAYERLKGSFDAAHSGENAHKTALLEEGMKFSKVAMTGEDAQFLETRKFQRSEIAAMFRVPPHMIGDLERATFCLPAGTEVLTPSGPKPVESMAVGDEVWSREDAAWRKSRVTRSICSGEDEILTIRTTNRTIRANGRHRILTRRKHAAPRPGIGGYQVVEWKDEYVQAADLKVGDTLVVLDGGMEGGIRRTPTRFATEGFMEFCGLLLGDGNVHPGYVTIARGAGARYMDHYRDVMRAEFVRYDGGNGRGNLAVKRAPVNLTEGERYTRFSSALASEELTRLGLSGVARTKSVPGWVYGMAPDLRLAFVRGFFDADGHVDKKGRMSASSCNRDLLSGIRHLCMMAGVPVTNLRCQRGRTTLPNGREMDFAQWSFTCSDPGANAAIGSNDPMDVERIAAGKPFDRKARAYPRFGGRDASLTGVSLSRISSIEVGEPEPVYDIEVEGTHNFVADGVVVHNSNIEQQSLDFINSALMPWLNRIEKAVRRDLFSRDDKKTLHVRFGVASLLRGDAAARATYYHNGIQDGWMVRNEARRSESELGIVLNPLDHLDEPLQPLNMVVAGTPPAPIAAPAPPAKAP